MRNYALLTAISAVVFVAVGINSPLLSLYLNSLGADYTHISFILTSNLVAMILGNYAWGRLSDRFGRRKPGLIAGLLGVSAAFAIISQIQTVEAAWITRIIEGIFMSAYATLQLAMLGDALARMAVTAPSGEGGRRGRNMGLSRAVGSMTFAAGAFFGGRLADSFGLSNVFVISAGLYLLAAVMAIFLQDTRRVPRPAPAVASQPVEQPRRQGFQLVLPVLFLVGVMLWVGAHSASATMWPLYMDKLGYTKSQLSAMWALAAFVEAPVLYFSGAISDIVGRAAVLATGSVIMIVVNLGYAFLSASLPLLLGIQFLRGVGFGSYTSSSMTYATELGGEHNRGSTSGLFNTASTAGSLIGTLIAGSLAQAFGFTLMYVFCAAAMILATASFLLLRYRTRRGLLLEPAA